MPRDVPPGGGRPACAPVYSCCPPGWPCPASRSSYRLSWLHATDRCRKVDAEALQAIKSQRAKARAEGLTSGSATPAGGTGRVTPPPGTVVPSVAAVGAQEGPAISPFASATSQGMARSPSSNNIGSLAAGLGHATSLPISMHSVQRSRRSPAGTPPASSSGARHRGGWCMSWDCGGRMFWQWEALPGPCSNHYLQRGWCLMQRLHATLHVQSLGSVLTLRRAPLPPASCLLPAADYDAMVSKMTITELVALKQAGLGLRTALAAAAGAACCPEENVLKAAGQWACGG